MTAVQRAHTGSLLKECDLSGTEFRALLDLARSLRAERHDDTNTAWLRGRQVALVFEKPSTRTRVAFEAAAADHGGQTIYIGPGDSHLGRDESVADTARVLGRMVDGIAYRGFAQSTVEQLATWSGVPVWNALTDEWHPTQMLADVLTMTDHHAGPLESIAYAYLGDARNNVARSLLVTGALLGMSVRIAAPAALQPPAGVRRLADELARRSGARVLITDDPRAAVDEADFVMTDTWVSMGESEEEWNLRVPILTPYRVTSELMRMTGRHTRFMHCLPSVHDATTRVGRRALDAFGLDGVEVTTEVFESADSIVFEQAENRLHTIAAVLVAALGR